jgi:hypothetical protein
MLLIAALLIAAPPAGADRLPTADTREGLLTGYRL